MQRNDNYYALYALSQVHEQQGEADEAGGDRRRAYEALIQSQDLSTKRALDTQILLNALAYYCTRADDPDRARDYRMRVLQLWSSIVAVDNLELRLFSLQQKKQVPKNVFIQDFM